MRRAEANLRLDEDLENGEYEEAGNDLYSHNNVTTLDHRCWNGHQHLVQPSPPLLKAVRG